MATKHCCNLARFIYLFIFLPFYVSLIQIGKGISISFKKKQSKEEEKLGTRKLARGDFLEVILSILPISSVISGTRCPSISAHVSGLCMLLFTRYQ